MSFLMMRSFAENLGIEWPQDAAYRTGDMRGDSRFVTWSEVMESRRKRQARELKRKRNERHAVIVPAYVWVFHNDWNFPYGGRYCYIISRFGEEGSGRLGHRPHEPNGRPVLNHICCQLMQEINLGLLPVEWNWETWKEQFIAQFPRFHKKDPRDAGSLIGWYDRTEHRFTRHRPNEHT